GSGCRKTPAPRAFLRAPWLGVIQWPASVLSFAVLAVLAPALAWVVPPEPPPAVTLPQIKATRAVKPPKIDGHLDDPAWPAAPVSESFTQHYPDEGAPPTERTFVRVLYDDRNLYVAVDCWQTHSPIVRRL